MMGATAGGLHSHFLSLGDNGFLYSNDDYVDDNVDDDVDDNVGVDDDDMAPTLVLLGHDAHDEGGPSGEGVAAYAFAGAIIVLLPEVAGGQVLPHDCVDYVLPQRLVESSCSQRV